MTDEELKRTYGIHLASRLQSDDAGKESKWADEDDDEDWVPKPIEWNDESKSSTEPAAALASEEANSIEKETPEPSPEKIIEHKAATLSTELSKHADSSAEKGPSKMAPPPRISPWAPIPQPSVVPIQPSRNEAPSTEYSAPLQANVSMHADEYGRSWRDRGLNSRELYNSETGQLEPVQDRRNRGLRNSRGELQLNKAQVLQRPPPISGPAEPSPAFQQSRAASYRPDDYRRRRTSSTVSGGSGSVGRRLSFNRGLHSLEQPIAPDDGYPPLRHGPADTGSVSAPSPQLQPYLPPNQSTLAPAASLIPQGATPESQTVDVNAENPVVVQQRIMKEAGEAARQRRQEEEAREEAAKRERLRVKLEALERKEAEAKAAKAAAEEEERAKVAAVAPEAGVTDNADANKVQTLEGAFRDNRVPKEEQYQGSKETFCDNGRQAWVPEPNNQQYNDSLHHSNHPTPQYKTTPNFSKASNHPSFLLHHDSLQHSNPQLPSFQTSTNTLTSTTSTELVHSPTNPNTTLEDPSDPSKQLSMAYSRHDNMGNTQSQVSHL